MLARIAKRMRPDGYLILGAAETVIGISDDFTPVTDARGLYVQQVAAAAAATPVPGTPASTLAPSTPAATATPAITATPGATKLALGTS